MSNQQNPQLDLRGVACPINYVKTKLKLEDMVKGEFLEVLLDEGEPIKNVPRSAREDGNKIIKLQKSPGGDHYSVTIKKG